MLRQEENQNKWKIYLKHKKTEGLRKQWNFKDTKITLEEENQNIYKKKLTN